jgi:hypothetical protein
MKQLLLILCTLCSVLIAHAQEVTYSEYQKFDIKGGDYAVVGKIGDRIYTYRGTSEGFFLDAYNDAMQLQATVVLDFFPKKIYEVRFVTYATGITLLYQSVEGNKIVQYAALLDDKGRLKKPPVKLDNTRTGLLGATGTYYMMAVSENKNSIVVYEANIHKRELELSCIWLDGELKVQKRSTAKYSAENDLAYSDPVVGNDGVVYIPVYTPTGVKDYADQLWILNLNPGETKFTAKELPLSDLFAANTYMKIDNAKKHMYIGGFYSDKKNGNYEGVLYANYNMTTGTYDQVKHIPFDERLRNETGERSRRRAFDDYKVKQLIVKNDGGFVLVAEEYYMSTRNANLGAGGYYSSYFYGPMSRSVREFHYNDIVALSYNDQGQRDWHTFVRKEQYSQEDGGMFSSYALMNSGGALGFLFNDYNASRSKIQFATIDAQGKQNLNALAAGGKEDPDWLPRAGKQVAAKELVVPCLRKKQICFAKVVF